MSRYRFYITDNKVICVSSYMGRSVRGVAKCSPNDEFNEEFGKKLAQARCDYKVAIKRYERALKKSDEADAAVDAAQEYADKMADYYWAAQDYVDETVSAIEALLEEDGNKN